MRIAVKALGLNRAEAMFRMGMYLEDPALPARLGYEAAGTIEAIGEGVQGFKVGDAVSTIPAFSQNKYGVYGDSATVPAFAVVKHPPSLSWIEAAAVWMQYATAYGALIAIADLKPADKILIPAASSSVGIAAIQIANFIGATPIALTRTGKKRQQLLDAGAAHVVATEEQDVVEEVMKITERQRGPRGVRSGRRADIRAARRRDGRAWHPVSSMAHLSPEPTPLPLFAVLAKMLTVRGYVLFEITGNPERLERAKKFIVEGLVFRQAQADDREDFPARRDRRRPSLYGIEPASRQDRRDGLARSQLWHGLPTMPFDHSYGMVSRPCRSYGMVSRPCHSTDRRSPCGSDGLADQETCGRGM